MLSKRLRPAAFDAPRDLLRHAAPSLEYARPERMVALGFRHWMRGRLLGDVCEWEKAFNLFTRELGLCGARRAVGTLSGWVGRLHTSATRPIEVGASGCPGFCRDECIAVSMIAACQHKSCPALRACAFALIQCSQIEPVIAGAQALASELEALDQRLSMGAIVTAPYRGPESLVGPRH